jgi:hypothetical protein
MGEQIGAPIKMNHDQYQIYGFFGCSSSYFAAKASKADPEGSRTPTSSPTASPARSGR